MSYKANRTPSHRPGDRVIWQPKAVEVYGVGHTGTVLVNRRHSGSSVVALDDGRCYEVPDFQLRGVRTLYQN